MHCLKKLKKKLLHKYRLVVLNEDTFEERFSFKLNRLNVFVFSTLFAFILIASTIVLIAFTPLREYIPGYSSTALRNKTSELLYKTDSLQREIAINETYLESVRKVLKGEITPSDFNKDSIIEEAKAETLAINLAASKEDSILRDFVAQEDKYNPLLPNKTTPTLIYAPLKGNITSEFDPSKKHFGIDIATIENAPIKAVADGTVIFAEWSTSTGYVLILKHNQNLLTVYKHNAALTKKQGERVKAGEVIATAGNTGEFSTGFHLHFELWREGQPVNPLDFLDFN